MKRENTRSVGTFVGLSFLWGNNSPHCKGLWFKWACDIPECSCDSAWPIRVLCLTVPSDWFRAGELGQSEASQDFAGILKQEAPSVLRKSQG